MQGKGKGSQEPGWKGRPGRGITHSANLILPGEGPAETSQLKGANQTEYPSGIWCFVYVILENLDKYLEMGVSVIYCHKINYPTTTTKMY